MVKRAATHPGPARGEAPAAPTGPHRPGDGTDDGTDAFAEGSAGPADADADADEAASGDALQNFLRDIRRAPLLSAE